jgi:prohibitin 1
MKTINPRRDIMQGKNILRNIIFIVIAIFVLAALLKFFVIVSDGEVGVKKTLGRYNTNELSSGIHFYMPIITQVSKVNTKLETIEENVKVPSQEGLIVTLDVSIIYRVRTDMAAEIKQTVTGDIKNTLLIPYIRNGIRDIISGYEAKSVYSEDGRKEIASKLKIRLEERLSDRLFIEDVLLRDVLLPEKVANAIEDKIDAEQKSQKKEFELISAEKDAEIEIARARGIAESNKIIAGSITDEYLKWKFIEALSLNSNANVIYVPTEANLPILEATRIS